METKAALQKKADAGDADACFRFAYRLAFSRGSTNPDWSRIVAYWRIAANAGHARAQFYLGTCYDTGTGVSANVRAAHRWYLVAAENDHEVFQEANSYPLS